MTKNTRALPPGTDQVEQTRRVLRAMENKTDAIIDQQTALRPAGAQIQTTPRDKVLVDFGNWVMHQPPPMCQKPSAWTPFSRMLPRIMEEGTTAVFMAPARVLGPC